jgi:hypothetical protein
MTKPMPYEERRVIVLERENDRLRADLEVQTAKANLFEQKLADTKHLLELAEQAKANKNVVMVIQDLTNSIARLRAERDTFKELAEKQSAIARETLEALND